MHETRDFRMKHILYFFSRQAYNITEKVGFFPSNDFFFFFSFPNQLPWQIPDSFGEHHAKLFLTDQRITVAGTKDIDEGEQSQGALRRKRWNSD